MQEMARQQYLEAMGIQTYMPKWVLPSAPLPLQCDLASLTIEQVDSAPALNASSATLTANQSCTADSVSAPEAVGDLLQSMLASAKVAESAKAPSKIANLSLLAKQQQSEKLEAFAVNLWQFTGLIVVADRQVQKALPVNVLLKNILIALGRSIADAQKPEVIKWPLEGLSAAQSGPADTYLKSILLARRFAGQATSLLCFGDMSSRNLLNQDTPLYAQTQVGLSDTEAMPAICLPSLEALIETPEMKASVWAAISHLRLS
ncbi:hypothetical protein R50072_05840 [Simiduia litorea]|uniref:hypothetical protein n=1 Tax=Simiduia litorea TaxID=1435348 RepID=UPI0036F2D53B